MRNLIAMPASAILCLLLATYPAAAQDAPALTQECGGVPPQLKPIIKTHTLAPYPTESQKRGEEGLTRLSVHIDKDGRPDTVKIAASSSYSSLDDAAADYIKRVWRWEPLRSECAATGATVPINYSWNLGISQPILLQSNNPLYPAEAREKGISGAGVVSIDISETGRPTATHIITTTGSQILDDAMQSMMMAQAYNPKMVNGVAQAFTGRMQIIFHWVTARAPADAPSAPAAGAP